jgi:hypothetical protein
MTTGWNYWFTMVPRWDSGWGQDGFSMGSGYIHSVWASVRTAQHGFRIGSGWVQNGFRMGSECIQAEFRRESGWCRDDMYLILCTTVERW